MTTGHDAHIDTERAILAQRASEDAPIACRKLTAAQVMDPAPLTVTADCPVDDLAALFSSSAADVAIVVDTDGCPVGLLTPADILRLSRLPDRPDLPPLRAANAASLGAFTARLQAPLRQLLEVVVDLGASHVVVVSEDGRTRGLIRSHDAMRALVGRSPVQLQPARTFGS